MKSQLYCMGGGRMEWRNSESRSGMTDGRSKLYYEIRGDGPELVLIHGLGNDLRQWEPLMRRLEGRLTLIAYDMRGSGRSEKSAGPYTIAEMAEDAADLIEGLGQPPLAVLGFSMGGCVALELALDRPDLVERLALVSTLPSWHAPYPPSAAVDELFHRTDVSDELLIEVYETVFGADFRRRVSAEAYVAWRMGDEYPQPLASYLNQLSALERFDVRERVGSISADTLVVAGSDDNVVPPENSQWLARAIERARLSIIDGAGHMVPVERPDELASIVEGWLLNGSR